MREKELKESLLGELNKGGEPAKYLIDLVTDYMSLWKTKNKLVADINKRGVMIEYDNGGGQSGMKKNECLVELPKISKRMTDILTFLNLEGVVTDDGDINI